MSQQDYEWRLMYAPDGYAFLMDRLEFTTLECACDSGMQRHIIFRWIDGMRRRFASAFPTFDESECFTRITIFPQQTGESLNHLDPLRPRLGLTLEMRWPLDVKAASAPRPALVPGTWRCDDCGKININNDPRCTGCFEEANEQ